VIRGIIKINVKVTGDNEFMTRGSSERKERIKVFEKMEYLLILRSTSANTITEPRRVT